MFTLVRMWSTYGCEVVNSGEEDDVDDVRCQCNHTSNFAILMQIVPFKVSKRDVCTAQVIYYLSPSNVCLRARACMYNLYMYVCVRARASV